MYTHYGNKAGTKLWVSKERVKNIYQSGKSSFNQLVIQFTQDDLVIYGGKNQIGSLKSNFSEVMNNTANNKQTPRYV